MSASAIGALERGSRRAPYRESVGLLANALQLPALERAEFEAAADRGRGRGPRISESPRPPNNLPVRLTSFVGRNDEIAAIKALLTLRRLVTVTGSGGVGKTRVALEVARQALSENQREAWFVDLSPLSNGVLAANAVAEVLDIPIGESADPVNLLVHRLKTRNILLILDNCEHLINEAAALARAVLHTCPNITILATSRERLALEGEHVYRMPSLAVPPATIATKEEALTYASLRLFIDRARAADAHFQFTNERVAATVEICRRLEGIPLAVELAATHASTLGLSALNRQLEAHLDLPGRTRDLPQRQQTMLSTIAWSYDLLSEPERFLLRRMSVFRGGISFEAAHAIAGDEIVQSAIPDLLSSLVEKSLLSSMSTDTASRFIMLETVRAVVLQKLTAPDDLVEASRAQAMWLASFAERAEQRYQSTPRGNWMNDVTPEIDNARSVFEWALGSGRKDAALLAARIICGLYRYWIYTVRYRELATSISGVLRRLDVERNPLVASRLVFAQLLVTGDHQRLSIAERYMPMLERHLDTRELISCHTTVAFEYSGQEKHEDAERAIARAFTLIEPENAPDARVVAYLFANRCNLRLRAGRTGEARSDLAEARRLASLREADHNLIAILATAEACIEFVDQNVKLAATLFEAAVDLEREQSGNAAFILSDLAVARLVLGEIDLALSAIREALELFRSDSASSGPAISCLAAIATLCGHHESAARLSGFSNAELTRRNRAADVSERASRKILVTSLSKHLSQAQSTVFEAAGARLPADEALEEALGVIAQIEAENPS